MKITATEQTAAGRKYVPVPIGNGDLSLIVDYEGSMNQKTYSGGMIPGIRRAGVRFSTVGFQLTPLGYFLIGPESKTEPESWSQTLDTRAGMVSSRCVYTNGTVLESESFCHPERPLICLRRRISGHEPLVFQYILPEDDLMTITGDPSEGIKIKFPGLLGNTEFIRITADKNISFEKNADGWSFSTMEREICIFINFGAEKPNSTFEEYKALSAAAWEKFYAEGRPLPHLSDKIAEVCETSLYHLKISSTKWSIPVGLFDTHWHGRYFGFDESFCADGLIAAGHLAEARKVIEFRYEHLDAARKRAYYYFQKTSDAVRYVWQAVEAPGVETAYPSFWLEHYFHMAIIAETAWNYVQASGDKEFLRDTAYPIIRGCAEFYRIHMLYFHDGKVSVGRCTDLERLGAARENAFMTSCGIIANFRIAAQAAETLGLDPEQTATWRDLADRIAENLANDGTKYIPYPECPDKSIAVLAGLYPFPALPASDPMQKAAVEDFFRNASTAGNMYPTGKSVCAWYAAWMAIAAARLGMKDVALKLIEETAEQTGCFSEIFEIYESGNHPWFTTAEGIFLRAVRELAN